MASQAGATEQRGADFDYGEFKIKLISLLDKPTIKRLAIYFDFPPAERNRIANDNDPGIEFIDHAEAKGLMTSSNVSTLIGALEKIDRKGVVDELSGFFRRPQSRKDHSRLDPRDGESDVMVPEEPESVLGIDIKGPGWVACDIVCVNEDCVVITGKVPKERHTFIAVIGKTGEVLRLKKIPIERESERRVSLRCSIFSKDKVALLCHTGRIGFYDTLSGSYTMKSISQLTEGWPSDQHVSSITTDPRTKDIFVGSSRSGKYESREVFVFDRNLKHRRTLKLPATVHTSWDFAFHRDNILVCDTIGERLSDVSVKEPSNLSVVRQYEKPPLDTRVYPSCVCKGSGDFIYGLWHFFEEKAEKITCILTQHSARDSQLLNTIAVDSDASAMCAAATKDGEKLLVVTATTGKLYRFGLFTV